MMKLALLLLPLMLTTAPALPAQSLLLLVSETADGTPLAAPFPSREGLAAAFFDDGLIIFDLPGGAPARDDALLATAVQAGADYLLELTVAYSDSGKPGPLVNAQAAFRLRSTPGGIVVYRGALEGTNKGRESTVDRQALGREIGEQVAQQVRVFLSRQPSP